MMSCTSVDSEELKIGSSLVSSRIPKFLVVCVCVEEGGGGGGG